MCNVWKAGSRWGNCEAPVLDKFLDYGVVFVGDTDDGKRQGKYDKLEAGDFILLSDGKTPVAVARALSKFQAYSEYSKNSGVEFRTEDITAYDCNSADFVVCRAKIKLVGGAGSNWAFDPRKRFCSVNDIETQEQIRSFWEDSERNDTAGRFMIDSRTVSLLPTKECSDSVFSGKNRYCIPIFHHPYSWGEKEITRLFQDLLWGVQNKEPMFMGTIQLSEPAVLDAGEGLLRRYQIIDGQQRITTFFLILRVLELMKNEQGPTWSLPPDTFNYNTVLRTLVNNGSAQDDLNEFLAVEELTALQAIIQDPNKTTNIYLRNAAAVYGELRSLFEKENSIEENGNCEEAVAGCTREEFRNFLVENIRFVVIETHAGLSKTLQIFSVINTTGLDLNGADVFKIRFFEFLTSGPDGTKHPGFNEITQLYQKVEGVNKDAGRELTSMCEILGILQRLLVAKYGLPKTLYSRGTDRFFEDLFDALLKIKKVEHFSSENMKKIAQDSESGEDAPLSISGVNKLIDLTCDFRKRYSEKTATLEDAGLFCLMEEI